MALRADRKDAAQIGHRVSHSNRKTSWWFLPNLLNVTLMSDFDSCRSVRLRISTRSRPSTTAAGSTLSFWPPKDGGISAPPGRSPEI